MERLAIWLTQQKTLDKPLVIPLVETTGVLSGFLPSVEMTKVWVFVQALTQCFFTFLKKTL